MLNLQKKIVLLLLITTSLFLDAGEPELAVRMHLKGMKERDYLNTYQTLSSKHFQNEITILDFQQFVDSNPILFKYSGYELGDVNDRGYASAYLKYGNEVHPLEYQLVHENGEWKVWSLTLLELADKTEKQTANDPARLISPINRLFDDLSNNNLSRAYFGTSIQFQHATPFDAFKDFIFANPTLLSHQMTLFEDGKVDKKRGVVKVNLQNGDEVTPVSFDLTYQEGGWKITGIEVEKTSNDMSSATLVNVTDVIENQLAAIRRGNITKAYTDFMAKKYRDLIPLEAFEQVVEENPEWKQAKDLKFTQAFIQFDEATLESSSVHYELVNENGAWKISKPQLIGR